MNIYQKLIEVRKVVPYLQKENKGYQFNYVSSSQVLASLKQKMDEVGLLLIPSVTSSRVATDIYEKQDNKGNIKRTVDYFTELEIDFTWVNAENPEEQIKCHWYGQGVDTAGEKGVGKALTYAEKYFMLKSFNIPTDKDDPDSFQEKQDKPDKPEPQRRKVAEGPPELITTAQAKRLFAIAGGNENAKIVKGVLLKYKYYKTDQIKKADYDAICKEIEDAVKAIPPSQG